MEKSVEKSKMRKSSKKNIVQINVRDIKLEKECRKRLNKVKTDWWGTVAHAIERGNWYIPVKNHRYAHIKKCLEDGMREFFDIDRKIPVEIADFETDIIEFDNH